MSAPAPVGGRQRRRAVAAVVVVVGLLVGIGLAAGPPRPDEAYDPRSVEPLGTAALVELLEGAGVDVEVSTGRPDDMSTRLFLAQDRLSDAERDQLRGWVEEGGTVVVAGTSLLHGLQLQAAPVADVFGVTTRSPDCDAAALDPVGVVEHGSWESLAVPADATSACFPAGEDAAWLVAQRDGEGTVIAVGSPAPFTNANLARADNAVLATALLAPHPGDRVAIVPPPAVGEGDTGVLELVPPGFWRLLFLLTVALVLGILWTARRLGQPVDERLPPVLPSAELAWSVAGLLQRAGDQTAAAGRLRADARRLVQRTWGLPAGTGATELAAVAVDRAGVPAGTAELALLDTPVRDDDALQQVASACTQLRAALRAGRGAASSPLHGDHAQDRG